MSHLDALSRATVASGMLAMDEPVYGLATVVGGPPDIVRVAVGRDRSVAFVAAVGMERFEIGVACLDRDGLERVRAAIDRALALMGHRDSVSVPTALTPPDRPTTVDRAARRGGTDVGTGGMVAMTPTPENPRPGETPHEAVERERREREGQTHGVPPEGATTGSGAAQPPPETGPGTDPGGLDPEAAEAPPGADEGDDEDET